MATRERGSGRARAARELPEEHLREEIAAWDSLFRTQFRLPPYNPDDLLSSRGIETYDRMMTDSACRAAINTKRFALLSRPWRVLPAPAKTGSAEQERAEEARDLVEHALRALRGPDGAPREFRSTLFEMMSAFYRGFSLAELVWRVERAGRWAGKYLFSAIKFKHPKQIGFEMDEFLNVRAVTSWTPEGGLARIPREKCLLYIHNQRDELPYGESDFRAVYKHWYSKARLLELWNLRLQRYGMPFAYATMSAGGEGAAARVLEMLREFQQEASAVFPPSVRPQLMEPRPEGADVFLNALEWHNQQIATGILLQPLSLGEGMRRGTVPLSRLHFDVLLFGLQCARQDIEAAVNGQLVRPLVDANFGHGLYPRFTLGNLNERDLAQLSQAVDVLLRHGVVAPDDPGLRALFNVPLGGEEGL